MSATRVCVIVSDRKASKFRARNCCISEGRDSKKVFTDDEKKEVARIARDYLYHLNTKRAAILFQSETGCGASGTM